MSETYKNKDGKLEITIEREPSKEVKSIEELKAEIKKLDYEMECSDKDILFHQNKKVELQTEKEKLNKRIAEAGKLGIVEKVEEVIEEPK